MANDAPRVVDKSSLTGVFVADSFLKVGVEGHMANDGDATIGLPVPITSYEDAITAFGNTSTLTSIVQFLLSRGLDEVVAVASDATHGLDAREDAWEALADDPTIRIRLTDDDTQATLAALANSCEDAELIDNKQFMVGALAAPNSKSTLGAAAAAIASKRGVLVGPGVYDLDANLLSGGTLAALIGAEIAKNPDITDSLNLYNIPATAGIEKQATTGLPLFRRRANGGAPIDDFQDLLDDGVSPLMQSPLGTAAVNHLRTTFTDDDTFDALTTLLIKDGVFLGIRDMLLSEGFLHQPNTASNRTLAASMTDTWLKAHNSWVFPIVLPNGNTGYGVTSTSSPDGKSFTISYFGNVVRGTNVINVNGTLTVPVTG